MDIYVDYAAIIEDLRYCPICGWQLFDHPSFPGIRCCYNHNRVFKIFPTTLGGLRVEMSITDEEYEYEPLGMGML